MSNRFEIGQTVYVYEHWSGHVIKSEIAAYHPESGTYSIKFVAIVNRADEVLDTFGGDSHRKSEDIWTTVTEAFTEIDIRSRKLIEHYCGQIKSIEDLILFPLHHCICGGEYEDFEAQQAYKIRVKELLGIELSKNSTIE